MRTAVFNNTPSVGQVGSLKPHPLTITRCGEGVKQSVSRVACNAANRTKAVTSQTDSSSRVSAEWQERPGPGHCRERVSQGLAPWEQVSWVQEQLERVLQEPAQSDQESQELVSREQRRDQVS